jgi:Rrf2 family iron-sulfur cluster assembly transcriptional regulator
MVDLALHEREGTISRRDIAQRQGISSAYLAQLFARLRDAGLVQSVMGPGGGYRLGRHASQISAGDVLRAVEEPLNPAACVEGEVCDRVDCCPTYPLWERIGRAVVEVLDAATLEALTAESSRQRAAQMVKES